MSRIAQALQDRQIAQLELLVSKLSCELFAAAHEGESTLELESELAQVEAELFELKIDAGYTDSYYGQGLMRA